MQALTTDVTFYWYFKLLRGPEIDSASLFWNFQQYMGARNRVGTGLSYQAIELEFLKKFMRARHRVGIWLSYRPARKHWLAELMPWNRFLGSIKVSKYGLWTKNYSFLSPPWIVLKFQHSACTPLWS
jgi:hypothetical protein